MTPSRTTDRFEERIATLRSRLSLTTQRPLSRFLGASPRLLLNTLARLGLGLGLGLSFSLFGSSAGFR